VETEEEDRIKIITREEETEVEAVAETLLVALSRIVP
jgi:hypothetical protein